jgi:hypothetical protein
LGLALLEWGKFDMKRPSSMTVVYACIVLFITGCSLGGQGTDELGTTGTEDLGATREFREITGQEALDLYGVGSEGAFPAEPTSTPLSLFPASAIVLENKNPYDPNETITILPMFTRPGLNHDGTWMGDLEAGTEVVVHIINQDRTACLVEGLTAQGWSTKGWVACNRLSFSPVQ